MLSILPYQYLGFQVHFSELDTLRASYLHLGVTKCIDQGWNILTLFVNVFLKQRNAELGSKFIQKQKPSDVCFVVVYWKSFER